MISKSRKRNRDRDRDRNKTYSNLNRSTIKKIRTNSNLNRNTNTNRNTSTNTNTNNLITQLELSLNKCKNLENLISDSKYKKQCKYGIDCSRFNPKHFQEYSHPIGGVTKIFKRCTNDFIRLTYNLFQKNKQNFPNDFFVLIVKYLKETDFTNYNSLYFNILANLSLHANYYSKKYDDKTFWNTLLIGMEESAVTGMFDITKIKNIQDSLIKNKSPDINYLSNTSLYFSKPYQFINN
jgi:hypothetical protein